MKSRLLAAALLASACANESDGDGGADARRNDARPGDAPGGADGPGGADAPGSADAAGAADAPVTLLDAPPGLAPHILITEVDTVGNDEFIEIYNPTDLTIDLRNYYLSDH